MTIAEAAFDVSEVRPLRIRHVAAVVVGNALEFYDFLTYAIFAVYIGRAFFPASGPASSLLLTLATFGVGFGTRPIGGLVIGTFADRVGRRPAMVLSFAMMGIAIAGVALTPTYAQIGMAGPLLIIFFRLLQGFALGGEVGPATAYLIEAAPPGQRGFYGTFQGGSQQFAILCAGIVGTGLAVVLDPQSLAEWGWRAAFLLGALVVPFSFFLIRSLPESPQHRVIDVPQSAAMMRNHIRPAVLGLFFLAAGTSATYVLLYISTFATTTLHLSAGVGFGVTLCIGISGSLAAPISGAISDRVGRRPVVLMAGTLLLVCIVPAFWAMVHFHTPIVVWAVATGLGILVPATTSPGSVSVGEAMPPAIRAGAFGTVYAVAIAIFGGSAQFNVEWLKQTTHSPLAPGFYVAAALVVGLTAASLMCETAYVKTGT